MKSLIPIYCYPFLSFSDMLFAAMFTLPPTFIFNVILRKLLALPKTFTIGEAMIVAQTVVILSTVIVANYTWYLNEDIKMDLINVAIVVSYVLCLLSTIFAKGCTKKAAFLPARRDEISVWQNFKFAHL